MSVDEGLAAEYTKLRLLQLLNQFNGDGFFEDDELSLSSTGACTSTDTFHNLSRLPPADSGIPTS